MLKNYVLIAFRVLLKNKVFSLINIFGLATGIACCILVMLFIQDEFNYEKGFANNDKVFRINTTFVTEGRIDHIPTVSPPIAPALAQVLPEVEAFCRVIKPFDTEINIVRYQDKSLFEKKALLVDSTFLDVFPYKLLEGDASTALDAPSSVLVSEELAARIFGKQRALDELLIIHSGNDTDTFRVTGVIAHPEFPSHVDADLYMSMNSSGTGAWVLSETTWANNNVVGGYLKLKDPGAWKAVESKLPPIVEMHAGAELRQSGRKKILDLQPLNKIRLYSDMTGKYAQSGGSITYIYIIGLVGILILLLACINFTNLTTARATQRSGEVGIRKSMGAFRTDLVRQFLGESFVIVLISVVVATGIIALTLPSFNEVIQKQLSFNAGNLPFIIAITFAIALVTALFAGSYPAFFLSAMKPTQVLKGGGIKDGSQWMRKGLVVFQFVITITLISGIVIIQKQLNYVQSKTLGFNTDNIIMIPMRTAEASRQYTTLKAAFEQLEGVAAVSATTSIPSTPLTTDWGVYKEGWTNEHSLAHDIVRVDAGYFDVLDIPIIAGRDFIVGQDNIPGDTINRTKIILNEASLKAFDIDIKDAVGTTIYFQPDKKRFAFTVVGVVADFHQFSLHRKIGPMMFILSSTRDYFPYLTVSISMPAYREVSAQMQKTWDQRIDNAPFESIFLQANLKGQYASEQRTSAFLGVSTVIAVLISCLGLYGLSVYVAERRMKEIGIRKVIGASVSGVVAMLSKEYIKLIGISFLISIPIGYYFMLRWLDGFAYRIDPGVTVFLVSGLISFFIAWLTVSFESFRAATRNPVDTLKVR